MQTEEPNSPIYDQYIENRRQSALVARRHGPTGHVTVMTLSQRTAHDKYVDEYVQALAPLGPVEYDLAESVAEDGWRLKRSRALEENIYALGHPEITAYAEESVDPPGIADLELSVALAHARSFMADPKKFQLLTLYETRLHRSMQRSLELLRAMQAERKAAREQALEEAMLLAQLSYHEGETYDPAKDFPPENGFEFSTAEIDGRIERKRRLKLARELAASKSLPPQLLRLPSAA